MSLLMPALWGSRGCSDSCLFVGCLKLEQHENGHDLRLHLCDQSSSRIDLQTFSFGPFLLEAGLLEQTLPSGRKHVALCAYF